MTVTHFPASLNQHRNASSGLTDRDMRLVDLLQVLTSTTIRLGSELEIGELAELGDAIAKLRSQVLKTSGHTSEGTAARQRCQRLIESAACGLMEASSHLEPICDVYNNQNR